MSQVTSEEMAHYKSEADLLVKRAIERALDPRLVIDPGKVLDMGSQ